MRCQDGHILMKWHDGHIWWGGKTVILDEITRRSYLTKYQDAHMAMKWQDGRIRWDDKMVASNEITWRSHCDEMFTFVENARWSHLMRCHWGRWQCQARIGHFLTVAFCILNSYSRKVSEVEITMSEKRSIASRNYKHRGKFLGSWCRQSQNIP